MLTGEMFIGAARVSGSGKEVFSRDPRTGEELAPGYRYGGAAEVARAAALAEDAFDVYRATGSATRAAFLERIADEITALAEPIADRAVLESGLPQARLTGEVARTTGQLRLFAATLREGSWHGARIDPAQPDRTPLPRADIRQRRVPLGPVAVFGASNFPLAFSVAGGDTASALAAGCPVVVKAHDAHLGTSELVASAVRAAVVACGLPEGVFSLLVGDGPELGTMLVTDPRIQAVGFTGSRGAGLALVAAAASRPQPIPVYAEMSSVNPVVLLPGALASRGAELGTAFVGSLTLGAGQFCTNPGLVLAVEGPGLDEFVTAAAEAVRGDAGGTMLTLGIAGAYASARDRLAGRPGVVELARGEAGSSAACGGAALLTVDGSRFTAELQEEVFGATSLVVRCADQAELLGVLRTLEGQLTATVHAVESDEPLAAELLPVLERKAGRILFNSWPTGVEVGHAMVHGGPFPATSDSRTTSVGSLAIERFLRPVAYQDVPAALLPPVLRDGNPEGVWRRIDGELSRD
ncbi:aldehyde dehydrogenase (NADP(+)) [Amycolatopsis tucumanensis]|uniref:Aldehyde dehydrogenase (NADP(+)) n=1 Tax=Amycolatopsis tucumanensis TaxID=401106 RepID=A0ABP7JPE4_9PSEU|nr:aldehyde dehydrogenase (NADP(+)) [Amycolatopsis tucumanensis]MCF6428316.1 aldehyde dehydrogenase (NADP(+)) [Amycolatopsis tucumanensis]